MQPLAKPHNFSRIMPTIFAKNSKRKLAKLLYNYPLTIVYK